MKLAQKYSPVLRPLGTAAIFAVTSMLLLCIFFGHGIFDRGGWSEKGGTVRYLDQRGYPLTGWQEIDGSTYYFSAEHEGAMTVGLFEMDGRRFFFDENGILCTGVIQTPEGLYYFSETGTVLSGWTDIDGGRCYVAPDGRLHTGWLESEESTYYLSDDGFVHTGWLEKDGERYYFHADGTMAVGTVTIDGVARHFASTGKYFVMVNPWNYVPDDYESNLVPIEGFEIDASCRDALAQMLADCRAAGNVCNMSSAYRSYDYQTTLFQEKVTRLMNQGYSRAAAEAETGRSIARPGTSEHQLGLAVDLKNGGNTYNWLAQNSWKYGFVVRYPTGTTALTGIYYEPWHLRYVGPELAEELYELGICVEAYLNQLTASAQQAA